jgi:hypothetical protein
MFECSYCKTRFLNEENFKKHKCVQESRTKELHTDLGKLAFSHYRTWFDKRNIPPPKKELFIGSKYYKSFIKFAEFSKKMGIPDNELYIELMSQDSILPQHWYNEDVYDYFLNHLDKECNPETLIRITLQNMEKISNGFECQIKEIFDFLRPSDVIRLIQSRNFSPWVLLLSKRFKAFLQTVPNYEEKRLIEKAINVDRWKTLMEVKRNHIPKTKTYLKQLDL